MKWSLTCCPLPCPSAKVERLTPLELEVVENPVRVWLSQLKTSDKRKPIKITPIERVQSLTLDNTRVLALSMLCNFQLDDRGFVEDNSKQSCDELNNGCNFWYKLPIPPKPHCNDLLWNEIPTIFCQIIRKFMRSTSSNCAISHFELLMSLDRSFSPYGTNWRWLS